MPSAPVTDTASVAPAAVPSADALTPAALAAERLAKLRAMQVKPESFPAVTDLTTLKAFLAEAQERGVLSFDTETSALDPMQADLVGVSLAVEPATRSMCRSSIAPAMGSSIPALCRGRLRLATRSRR